MERSEPSRNTPPRQRYRLGDMTTLRSCLRAFFKAEGLGEGMADVALQMASLGEDGQIVTFEEALLDRGREKP